jgi:TP901 family phage tail tape measure protein
MAIIVPITTTFDNKGLNKAIGEIKKAEGGFNKFAKTTQIVGASMKDTGKTLSRNVTAPLVAFGAIAVKSFADFDSAITKSTAIMSGVTEKTRDDMTKAARDVAKNLGMSHTAAADSYYFLASAGLDAQQSIAALPQVAAFAKAGMFDMATATDLATDAQSALGLTSKDATKNLAGLTRVSDVLVKANTLANASVEQFSTSLTNKAGAALKSVNKDIEEGVAVLAAFADQGIKGEEAGTQFAIVMRDLQTRAIKNAGAFKANNVAVFDATGKMRNMADIVSDLEKALAGTTDKQKKMTLATMGFTDKSMGALTALLGTSDRIRDYETALRKAGGTTQSVADKQMASLTEQINVLKAELTDLAIEVAPTIIDGFVKPVMNFIRRLVLTFQSLSKETQTSIIKFAMIAAVLGPALIIIGSLISALGKIALAVKAVGIMVGFLKAQWIGAGIAAGAAATATVTATTIMKRALITTGVGALIVGLGYVAAKFYDAAQAAGEFGDAKNRALRGQESRDVARSRGRNAVTEPAIDDFLKELNIPVFDESMGSSTKGTKEASKAAKEAAAMAKEVAKQSKGVASALGKMNDKLTSARDKLKQAKEAHRQYRDSVKDSIVSQFSFTSVLDTFTDGQKNATDAAKNLAEAQLKYKDALKDPKDVKGIADALNQLTTAQKANADATKNKKTFLQVMRDQASAAVAFAAKVKKLMVMGLSKSGLDQVIAAGADAGGKIADELIAGGASAIKETNSLINSVNKAATDLGKSAADQFYKAGVTQGEAMVNGIIAAVEKAGFIIKGGAVALPKHLQKAINSGKLSEDNITDLNQLLKNVPKLAKGGIVTGPTLAMIGEAGPEAVVPLSGRNAAMGTVYNINVNAGIGTNGAQVGREIVDAIKRYERTSGPVFASA